MSRRDHSPRALDQAPLEGAERNRFERAVLSHPAVKGNVRLVARELIHGYLWGRADCYPGAPQIAADTGRSIPTVKRCLAVLDAHKLTVRVIDRSILPAQRRIIFLAHPHAAAIIAELRANPNVAFLQPGTDGRAEKEPRQKRLPLVGGGVSNPVGAGVSKIVGGGVSKTTPLACAFPVTVETQDLETVGETGEKSLASNGNGNAAQAGTGREGIPELPPIFQALLNAPPSKQAPQGRDLTPSQAELFAKFTAEDRRRFDAAPREVQEDILRTCRGFLRPTTLDSVRIKLANAGMVPTAAEVLCAVLGRPAEVQAREGQGAREAAQGPARALHAADAELSRVLESIGGATADEIRSLAVRLTLELRDGHSRRFWAKVLSEARQGLIPPRVIVAAVAKRDDPTVDRPAAAAAALVQKFRRARRDRLAPADWRCDP